MPLNLLKNIRLIMWLTMTSLTERKRGMTSMLQSKRKVCSWSLREQKVSAQQALLRSKFYLPEIRSSCIDNARIVRDYDKYITRQLNRGTSRKELNVSWLKKHELEIKRNMAELRDNIKTNWTTTGQELGKDLRQFWQSSRPASPARTPTEKNEAEATSPRYSTASPSALSRLSHLEIPKISNANGSGTSDFAAGYSLGLIGGVRSWVSEIAFTRHYLTILWRELPLTLQTDGSESA